MKTTIISCYAMLMSLFSVADNSFADMFGSGANQFTIDFVTIGNPGNFADTTGAPNPAGSVPYVYQMGKHEVSRDMVEKANAAASLGIPLADMTFWDGNGPNKPATGVSWNEAARFVNWLNASQGFSPAYKFSQQPGEIGYDANADIHIWQVGDPGFNPQNVVRNSHAHYFLPNVDEWYKAAYYDPGANGGTGGYWDYPTGSDSRPAKVRNGTEAGTAVYDDGSSTGRCFVCGPADTTQAGGLSPYGVMGLGGNVTELQESYFDNLEYFFTRGGNFAITDYDFTLSAFFPLRTIYASDADFFVGFRVASIPEPSALPLTVLGILGLLMRRRRAS